MTRRLRRRAKSRHARCSPNKVTTKLNECAGVNKAKRLTRNNCAPENNEGRPRPVFSANRELIKSSGMYGEIISSRAAVPVGGSCFMRQNDYTKKLCASAGKQNIHVSSQLL